ncbi:hypothetical protein MTO96_015575 [Rhipicephalus appendiculatus]
MAPARRPRPLARGGGSSSVGGRCRPSLARVRMALRSGRNVVPKTIGRRYSKALLATTTARGFRKPAGHTGHMARARSTQTHTHGAGVPLPRWARPEGGAADGARSAPRRQAAPTEAQTPTAARRSPPPILLLLLLLTPRAPPSAERPPNLRATG